MEMWALLTLLVGFSWAVEGQRIGSHIRQSLKDFDVPENAKIILNGKVSCDLKALKEYSWHSLVGKGVSKGRKCMGVDESEPIFVGR